MDSSIHTLPYAVLHLGSRLCWACPGQIELDLSRSRLLAGPLTARHRCSWESLAKPAWLDLSVRSSSSNMVLGLSCALLPPTFPTSGSTEHLFLRSWRDRAVQ